MTRFSAWPCRGRTPPRFYLAVAFYRQDRLDKAAALFATLAGSSTRLTDGTTIGEWAGRFMEQWE